MSRDIVDQLGARIRMLREARGWTQFEMAERVGIDRSYLSEVETGKIELCVRNLALIADAFGMEPWELLRVKAGTKSA